MRWPNGDPEITVGISPDSEVGVAIAAYSSRHSRMWVWDAESLEVRGFQDIRARVELLDVSHDGRYCAYFACAHARCEHYVAISRPPYFHALWLRNAFHLRGRSVVFGDDGVVTTFYGRKEEAPWSRLVEEYTAPSPTLRFETSLAHEVMSASGSVRVARYAGVALEVVTEQESLEDRDAYVGFDRLGRKITVNGCQILADSVPLLDCTRREFQQVTPPEWALTW